MGDQVDFELPFNDTTSSPFPFTSILTDSPVHFSSLELSNALNIFNCIYYDYRSTNSSKSTISDDNTLNLYIKQLKKSSTKWILPFLCSSSSGFDYILFLIQHFTSTMLVFFQTDHNLALLCNNIRQTKLPQQQLQWIRVLEHLSQHIPHLFIHIYTSIQCYLVFLSRSPELSSQSVSSTINHNTCPTPDLCQLEFDYPQGYKWFQCFVLQYDPISFNSFRSQQPQESPTLSIPCFFHTTTSFSELIKYNSIYTSAQLSSVTNPLPSSSNSNSLSSQPNHQFMSYCVIGFILGDISSQLSYFTTQATQTAAQTATQPIPSTKITLNDQPNSSLPPLPSTCSQITYIQHTQQQYKLVQQQIPSTTVYQCIENIWTTLPKIFDLLLSPQYTSPCLFYHVLSFLYCTRLSNLQHFSFFEVFKRFSQLDIITILPRHPIFLPYFNQLANIICYFMFPHSYCDNNNNNSYHDHHCSQTDTISNITTLSQNDSPTTNTILFSGSISQLLGQNAHLQDTNSTTGTCNCSQQSRAPFLTYAVYTLPLIDQSISLESTFLSARKTFIRFLELARGNSLFTIYLRYISSTESVDFLQLYFFLYFYDLPRTTQCSHFSPFQLNHCFCVSNSVLCSWVLTEFIEHSYATYYSTHLLNQPTNNTTYKCECTFQHEFPDGTNVKCSNIHSPNVNNRILNKTNTTLHSHLYHSMIVSSFPRNQQHLQSHLQSIDTSVSCHCFYNFFLFGPFVLHHNNSLLLQKHIILSLDCGLFRLSSSFYCQQQRELLQHHYHCSCARITVSTPHSPALSQLNCSTSTSFLTTPISPIHLNKCILNSSLAHSHSLHTFRIICYKWVLQHIQYSTYLTIHLSSQHLFTFLPFFQFLQDTIFDCQKQLSGQLGPDFRSTSTYNKYRHIFQTSLQHLFSPYSSLPCNATSPPFSSSKMIYPPFKLEHFSLRNKQEALSSFISSFSYYPESNLLSWQWIHSPSPLSPSSPTITATSTYFPVPSYSPSTLSRKQNQCSYILQKEYQNYLQSRLLFETDSLSRTLAHWLKPQHKRNHLNTETICTDIDFNENNSKFDENNYNILSTFHKFPKISFSNNNNSFHSHSHSPHQLIHVYPIDCIFPVVNTDSSSIEQWALELLFLFSFSSISRQPKSALASLSHTSIPSSPCSKAAILPSLSILQQSFFQSIASLTLSYISSSTLYNHFLDTSRRKKKEESICTLVNLIQHLLLFCSSNSSNQSARKLKNNWMVNQTMHLPWPCLALLSLDSWSIPRANHNTFEQATST